MDTFRRRLMVQTPSEKPPEKTPLTFTALSSGNILWKIGAGSTPKTIQYSKNGGEWTSITSTSGGAAIEVVEGDVVRFKGSSFPGGSNNSYSKFGSTCDFKASGNPSSLRYGENLTGTEQININYAYYRTFHDCTGLIEPPVLPITIFNNRSYCYNEMFSGCNKLTTAPELPATTLSSNCYMNMFRNCTSLTAAPVLPAATLTSNCYRSMFYGCTSLTAAPDLLATTLTTSCYNEMFRGCSNLASVKCLATSISAQYALSNWLYGVKSNGTFTKAAGVTWPSGNSGIPSTWTVIEI